MSELARDEWSIGSFVVNSASDLYAASLAHGAFDLGFFFPSWDARCLCLLDCNDLTVETSVEVSYANRGASNVLENNREKIRSHLNRISRATNVISVDSSNARVSIGKLNNAIRQKAIEKGRPLKIFIDLSSASRLYVLSLMSFGFQKGLVESIAFFYSEGAYEKSSTPSESKEVFTGGRWEAIAVPGLEGDFTGGVPFSFLVSIGFEGAKTLRVVNRAEPSRLAVLVPDPGVTPEYGQHTRKANAALMNEYLIKHDDELVAGAADLIAASKALEASTFESVKVENTVYLCCGTKPHAIALALRALWLKSPTVLYNKPDRHVENATRPAGKFWSYTISDRSVFR